MKHILTSGGTTKEQIKAKFELADNNELRPLLATLQTEGLVKVGHGYYPTAKLVEAYKVTNCFNTINTINNVQKEPPIPDNGGTLKTQMGASFSDEDKRDNRDKNNETDRQYSFFEVDIDGANGKTKNQEPVQTCIKTFRQKENTDNATEASEEETSSQNQMPTHTFRTYYRRLAPNQLHLCDGLVQGGSCPTEAKYLIGEGNYYCEKHFQASMQHCNQNGYVVIEGYPNKTEETR